MKFVETPKDLPSFIYNGLRKINRTSNWIPCFPISPYLLLELVHEQEAKDSA